MRVNAKQAIQRVQQLLGQRQFREAGEITRQLFHARPDGPVVALLHGETMLRCGRIRDAVGALEVAVGSALPPVHQAAAWALLGECRSALGDDAGSFEALERAIALQPSNPAAMNGVVNALIDAERFEDAETAIGGFIVNGVIDPAFASVFARLKRRQGRAQDAIEQLARAGEASSSTSGVHAALGQCLEAVGRFDEAFESFRRANVAMGVRMDRGALIHQEVAALAGLREMNIAADSASVYPRIVLIVGMPRSGTSLTEQIFASHPEVGACGESQSLPAMARRVCKDLNRPITPSVDHAELLRAGVMFAEDLCAEASRVGTAVVTDKNPMNLFLLSVAAPALPGLRVVRCRRSAMDVCTSCYTSPLGPDHTYACDLVDCAMYFAVAERVLDAAAEALGPAMMELSYEKLVRDPEPSIRALLDHAGLTFDERCLTPERTGRVVQTISRDQVTSAISDKSVGRWKRFSEHVTPLRETLEREGVHLKRRF